MTPSARAFHDETQSVKVQSCEICNAHIDFGQAEPLTQMKCGNCGHPFTVPGRMGVYKLVDVAGRGGMGIVYKAYDPGLNRYVALKLLRQDRADDQKLVQELAEEAVIAGSISHPNVGHVFATGMDRGRFYIVMELLEKSSLHDLMERQGKVAELQILEIAIQVAAGLQAAKDAGLIHRDIKPGNILFADERHAKIVDFGLAAFEGNAVIGTGEIWGTPYYLPPERLDGMPEDFRSDMYALGATLFHALAGRPPFDAATPTAVALKHLKSKPVSLKAFAPHVSTTTSFVVNRMLEKEPLERFQSYADLIQHLEYARDELLQKLQKQAPKARVPEVAEDRRAWGWMVAGIVAVAAIVVFVTLYFNRQVRPDGESRLASSRPAPAQESKPQAKDSGSESKPLAAAVATVPNSQIAGNEWAGRYRIIGQATGKAMAIEGSSKDDSAKAIASDYTANQIRNDEWDITDLGDGHVKILNAESRKALVVLGASLADGAEIVQWRYNPEGRRNDDWKLEPIENGFYRIVNGHSNKVVESKDDTTFVQRPFDGGASQRFQLTKVGEP